jgi:hypothetical protein
MRTSVLSQRFDEELRSLAFVVLGKESVDKLANALGAALTGE